MITLTETQYKYFELFKQNKTVKQIQEILHVEKQSIITMFARLRTLGLLHGVPSNYSVNPTEQIVVKQKVNKQKERAKEASVAKKEVKAKDDYVFYGDRRVKVETPINLSPLVFNNGFIKNVYPKFAK